MNLIALVLFSLLNGFSIASIESNDSSSVDTADSKVLSRRKRYLIFPDGSSFQLVFEAQNLGYRGIDIAWFANTAALAWELPSDPNIFNFLKNKEKAFGQRREDNQHIVYLDEDGKVISVVPYKRKKMLINPAMGKRSTGAAENRNKIEKVTVKQMHKMHEKRIIIEELNEKSTEFHRTGRKSLYEKLEKFFEGLGWKGKECILRLLCETAAAKKKQGTFFKEIIKATFTFPRGSQVEEYDIAASSAKHNCVELYPECKYESSIKRI